MGKGNDQPRIVVIGGGFTGLAAAYEISRQQIPVTVIEKDNQIGGLAASFEINGEKLEKFYHHWLTNDEEVFRLLKELDCENNLQYRRSRTGIYRDNNFFRLSTPVDLLRFSPLSPLNRVRLGLLTLRARRIKKWKQLESMTAEQWLLKLGGAEVYRVVWEPLLRGKFGSFGPEISAAWIWNKMVLRGGSRSKTGEEVLLYYRGGFAAFAEQIANRIKSTGGVIRTGAQVKALMVKDGRVNGVQTSKETIDADLVIATPALPIVADLVQPHVSEEYAAVLKKVTYLANVCLVLHLDRNLSDIYWLNVNDPNFPFVAVIEHTNFESAETYGGAHIVYLSSYLPEAADLYRMQESEVFEFFLPYISRMFPRFDRSWVCGYHVWKARYAQPVVMRNHGRLIPSSATPLTGLYLATMAQIYPEDRGTNYAIREGRRIGRIVAEHLVNPHSIASTI